MATSTANGTSSGVAAGRPQPQTTAESAGGPFVRYSRPGRRTQYQVNGVAFSGLVNQPLVAAPGYTRGYRVTITGSGGTGTATVTAGADAPGSICALVQLKDAFGTPLIVAPGYEALQVIQLFGGQFGLGTSVDVQNLPSYSPVATGADGSGNFTLSTFLPLEFAKAYGVISSANASLLPTLQFNLNTASGFYGATAPTTAPTMQFTVDQDFYWLPDGVAATPPGLGTTEQWVYQPSNPVIGSAATQNVQFPRLGGYLSVIVAELRDANGARTTTGANSGWPAVGNRLRFIVDGVPVLDSLYTDLQNDMAINFLVGNGYGGSATAASTKLVTAPTGILAISNKNGLSQQNMGLFDTGETYLSTNPGTQLELAAAPWGGVTSGPMTLNALCGQVVPSGAMIQGLPEV